MDVIGQVIEEDRGRRRQGGQRRRRKKIRTLRGDVQEYWGLYMGEGYKPFSTDNIHNGWN